MDINSLYSVEKVKDNLIDQESLNIYEARLQYAINRDQYSFYNRIVSKQTEWSVIPGFDLFYSHFTDVKKIILFGAGNDGRHALDVLNHSKYADSVFAFCDNNESLWGTTVESLPVISPKELLSTGKYLIIICSQKYLDQIYKQIIWNGYPQHLIFYPPRRFLYAISSVSQYFGVFNSQKHEIFVDAGCYDGSSSLKFIKWCKGDYQNIYAFEPSKENYGHCEEALRDIANCILINKGVWSRKDVLSFNQNSLNPSGSNFKANGKLKVPVIDIDSVLKGKPVTFIKMDVEGSELEALKGAKNTIMNFHPRMAICLYHKPEDIFEIPAYILQLNNEYKFYLRHHTSGPNDTILYAVQAS